MRSYVDTKSLEGCPLQLRAKAPGRFAIVAGDHEAGRIALSICDKSERWCWTVTGPQLPVFLQPDHGEAETLAEAHRDFGAKFDAWRRWAKGSPAVWNT